MLPYRYNQRTAVNPRLGERFWGHAILPGLSAVRVDPGGEWQPCLTQVIESPWGEDDAGVPIDVENVWAVRTRCLADLDGGEVDWWTFVPRQLPEGYTAVGRCGRIVPLIADHLGENPFLGVVRWDEYSYVDRPVRWRTPTGQYPSDLDGDGYLWVPMNLNRQVLTLVDEDDPYGPSLAGPSFTEAADSGIATGLAGPGCSVPYSTGPNLLRSWGYGVIGRHVGFRGGRIHLRVYDGRTCPIASSESAGNGRLVIGWSDDVAATDELPENIVFDETYTFDDLEDVGAGEWHDGFYYNHRFELVIDLPELLVPLEEGAPKHWILFYGSNFAGFPVRLEIAKLSPRHDIPLWYWSSQRNRVAPGGVIIP